ncbi:MAG: trypsin-like peptidase domain-containing protein [bacterium]|nr:trypsin-like peptidase domain-containing protein [bacterium]
MEEVFGKIKSYLKRPVRIPVLPVVIILVVGFAALGFSAGILTDSFYPEAVKTYLQPYLEKLKIALPGPELSEKEIIREYIPQTTQEQAVINVVKDFSPAVVSIIITKDLPVIEEYYVSPFNDFFGQPFEFKIPQYRQKGTEKKEIGGGSGFIVSEDGIVLTNKHVVLDAEADYTILTNDGRKFPAKVLAKDPAQDLAVLKIEKENVTDNSGNLIPKPFAVVKLGDSSKLEIGQTVIAIGNALGEFRNTISVGVVSGLGRTITASGGGFVETLEDVIQTDAAINQGNSGGPLLNLRGEVIGINTATVLQAQNIGFAIPINLAKRDIQQVKTIGKIVYPFLGVRYVLINDKVKEENNLPVDYGAWVVRGETAKDVAVVSGSAADKVGIKDGDIILRFNNEKVTTENSLAKIIQKYSPGETVSLKVLRNGKENTVSLILGERSE